MRALAVTRGRGAALRLRDVPDVTPAVGEVVVRTRMSTINRGERSRLASANEGHVFGWDVVGELTQDCPELELSEGALVVGLAGSGGGWAERTCVRAADLAGVPLSVPMSAAATLPVAGLTALRAVSVSPALLGSHLLVTGSGAVASFAVQLAALAGATVHVVARRAESARHLASLGATSVTLAEDEWPADFDMVVDTVGGAYTPRALAAARAFGRVVVVGNLGDSASGIASSDLLSSGATVQGYRLVVDSENRPVGRDLSMLIGLVAAGRLATPDVREIDWEDTALVDSAVSDGFGRVRAVLRMNS